MPKVEDKETEILNFKPVRNVYRNFKIAAIHFPKIIPSLTNLIPIPLSAKNYKQIENDGITCEKNIITNAFEQKGGNTINEEGFDIAEFRYWIDCSAGDGKLDVLFFGNHVKGDYTKIRKIVEEEVCEEDPKTKEPVCHMEKKLKYFDREITDEVKKTAAKVIKAYFFKSNMVQL